MNAKRTDRIATWVFWTLGIITVSILAFIILEVLGRGLLTALNPRFLFGKPKAMTAGAAYSP